MGLLDDAIREHLDLKRQHGADPSEINRLEHEALGPVRRQPLEPGNQESVPQAEVDDRSVESEGPSELTDAEYEEYAEEPYEEAETDDWGKPVEGDLQRPGSQTGEGERPPATSDRPSTEPPSPPKDEAGRGLRRWIRSRRGGVPPEDAPRSQAQPPENASRRDETAESGVEDALAAQGSKRGEGPAADQPLPEEGDVLEETPEFLQDAPEHDRLWFEQRPPRDFDFDD